MLDCEAYGAELVAQLDGNPCNGAKNESTEAAPQMVCRTCSWVYDPQVGEPNQGVEAGTSWENVPESFLCPVCFMGKDDFIPATDNKAKAA